MVQIVLIILVIDIIFSAYVVLKLWSNSKKEIDEIIQLNIKNAKYDNGSIFVEIEHSNYKASERYNIDKVKVIDNKFEKDYINKYYNGYGELVEVELYCSSIL